MLLQHGRPVQHVTACCNATAWALHASNPSGRQACCSQTQMQMHFSNGPPVCLLGVSPHTGSDRMVGWLCLLMACCPCLQEPNGDMQCVYRWYCLPEETHTGRQVSYCLACCSCVSCLLELIC